MRHAPVASTRYALLSTIWPFAGAVTTAFTVGIGRQRRERRAGEVDDELLLVFGELGVAAADARLRDPRSGRALFLLHALPVQPIREIERLARRAARSRGTQYATMLSLVSSGVLSCMSSTRPGAHVPVGSTHALGRSS